MKHITPILPFTTRKLPGNYQFYGGSAAVTLARNGISYVNQFVRSDLGQQMVHFYMRTQNADEMFFQTVLMNSQLRDTVVNDKLRYVDWSQKNSHPKIITKQDYQRLKDSGQLFARKFDIHVDAEILDMLDNDIG